MDAYSQAGIDDAGEPVGVDPLTEQEMHAIAEDKLQLLGETLAKRCDEWVTAKRASGVEKRWVEDTDQYLGIDEATKEAASMMNSVERGFPVTNQQAKPQRSTVYINITRPKTNAAEARIANMLCPTDDKNWGIKPTPRPELSAAVVAQASGMQAPTPVDPMSQQSPQQGLIAGAMQQPQAPQPPQQDSASLEVEEAKRRAGAMEDEIDDQLTECDYNGQQRMLFHDCALLGTGIMKGPIVVNRVSKVWQPVPGSSPVVYKLEIVEEKKPASERVSPWNVFPDPSCGEDIHDGIGIFEKKIITSKQLRELAKQPGYLKDQIAKVLEEGPLPRTDTSSRELQAQKNGNAPLASSDHYVLWEYWGEFKPEDLRSTGVDIADGSTDVISGCVIMVNNHVIKGFLNPIETGDIPYDFMVWELVDESCWGYGIPRLMNPAQRVLNAAWRQMMDNSGLSVGPQIVVNSQAVKPADSRWELTGRKIWKLTDSSIRAQDAFSSFDVSSHVAEIQQIIEMAMRFADEESSVPALAQGEQGTAPETVGGMQLLMNSSNVALSRMVKQYDTRVTRRHIRRYYDWNMAYNPKEEIKGDFQIDAVGSSALLVRDMQSQALLQLGQFQANPEISMLVNWEEWFKEILKAQHVDSTKIMKSEDEIIKARQTPPQPSPEEAKAQAQIQVAQMKAESDQKIAATRAQGEQTYAQTEAQMAHDNMLMKMEELKLKREIAMIELSNKQNISLSQIKADLAKVAMQDRTKKEMAAAEIQLAVREGEMNKLGGDSPSLVRDEINDPNTP